MKDIPTFPYELLWEERSIKPVAYFTRRDGDKFLALAAQIPIKTKAVVYPLKFVNIVLNSISQGELNGSAVVDILSSTG